MAKGFKKKYKAMIALLEYVWNTKCTNRKAWCKYTNTQKMSNSQIQIHIYKYNICTEA